MRPTLLLVAPSRLALSRFAFALDGLATVHPVPNLAAAEAHLAAEGVVLVVVDVCAETAAVAPATLRRLRDAHPHVPRSAYLDAPALGTELLPVLFDAGAGTVVFRDWDDAPAQLRQTLAQAMRRAPSARLVAQVAPRLPRPLRAYFQLGVEHPEHCTDVATIAAMLGISRRTLIRRFARFGPLTPRRFFSWCRVLLACAYLDEGTDSVEQVAFHVALSGANALRLTVRRHLPGHFTELRAGGAALARATNAFLAEVSRPADVTAAATDPSPAPDGTPASPPDSPGGRGAGDDTGRAGVSAADAGMRRGPGADADATTTPAVR